MNSRNRVRCREWVCRWPVLLTLGTGIILVLAFIATILVPRIIVRLARQSSDLNHPNPQQRIRSITSFDINDLGLSFPRSAAGALIPMLADPNAGVRASAAMMLAEMRPGDDAVAEALVPLLQDTDPLVRAFASRYFCDPNISPDLRSDSKALSCAISMLSVEEPLARRDLVLTILSSGSIMRQPLLEGLSHEAPSVRALCAELLGEMFPRDAQIRIELARAIQQEADQAVRRRATWALGATGGQSIDMLGEVVRTRDPIRRAAVLALWRVGKEALPVLVELAESSGADPELRDLITTVIRDIERIKECPSSPWMTCNGLAVRLNLDAKSTQRGEAIVINLTAINITEDELGVLNTMLAYWGGMDISFRHSDGKMSFATSYSDQSMPASHFEDMYAIIPAGGVFRLSRSLPVSSTPPSYPFRDIPKTYSRFVRETGAYVDSVHSLVPGPSSCWVAISDNISLKTGYSEMIFAIRRRPRPSEIPDVNIWQGRFPAQELSFELK